jgi:diacylglycerol kinase family enzyme
MPMLAASRPPAARWLARGALALGAAAVVLVAIMAIKHFPRGLFLVLMMTVAVVAASGALLRTGVARVLGAGVAVLAVAASLTILVSDLLASLAVVIVAAGAVGCAGAALRIRVRLQSAPAPKRPVMIYNPKSGGGKATRFKLADEARTRGIEPVELSWEIPLAELVEDLIARGVDGLAVAGGDGTQAQVAAIAARQGIPFACIPAGTRNHFALDLGVDRDDVVGALDAFVDGHERLVDLAEVNGKVFVNNVSLGVYADAVQQPGYRDAKLRTLMDVLPRSAARREDTTHMTSAGPEGHAAEEQVWHGPDGVSRSGGIVLLVSNNVYRLGRLIGSGTRPRLDQGILGVTVIEEPTSPRRYPVRSWAFPSLEVETDQPTAAGVDGEAVTLDPPIRFTIRPGALRVRLAPSHPGCSPSAGMPSGVWGGLGLITRIAAGRA